VIGMRYDKNLAWRVKKFQMLRGIAQRRNTTYAQNLFSKADKVLIKPDE